MKELIDGGHLYIAQPPLYRIKKGKEQFWVYSEKDKEELIAKLGSKNLELQRYKGLGEMNPEELYETTMNRETRKLKRVTYEDFIENDLVFSKLMGKEVKARKKFIISHFDEVSTLDI